MEKKKLLLVAVAVGIVLLIIIGIPLLMIAPRQRSASPLQSSLPNIERDWATVVEPAGVQRTQSPSARTAAEPQSYEVTFSEPVEAPHITTLTVPVPETAAVPDTPVTSARKPSTVKLTTAQPAALDNPPAAKAVTVAVKAAPAPQAAAKSPAANSNKAHNNYWVQTGAFSTKIRAEGAKESLASKGIASIIDNRDIDGKTWYRVRVGPYISETEANYWLALVKSIDGFAESQIRLTQAVQ
ncbi:MAG: SPOR domain-containing protein [Treponema sp.]|jgi:DedD protein|nr:SPOR domain-containing protein [Treponema sp.]